MKTTDSPEGQLDRSTVPTRLVEAVRGVQSPIVIGHVVPDADALGSMLALALALQGNRCIPKVSIPSGTVSQKLSYMVEVARPAIATRDDFGTADSFIVVDTARKDRCNVGPDLRETDWSKGRPILNIDHHSTNTRFGEVNWVVDTASSTCELIYYVLRATAHRISPLTASLLYSGIVTDTLGFSLPTVRAECLRAAAELVELGADVADIGERLCRSQRQSEFDLLRVIYANTRRVGDGRVAYSTASFEEIHGAGCTAADIDDQINVPRSLDGVQLAMLFSEGRRGKTRINFRSSGDLEVLPLAQEFGGGGHAQASGAILDCSLQEAVDRVVPRAIEYAEGR